MLDLFSPQCSVFAHLWTLPWLRGPGAEQSQWLEHPKALPLDCSVVSAQSLSQLLDTALAKGYPFSRGFAGVLCLLSLVPDLQVPR